MKTVLPQNTGAIEWGGVPLAVILAIGLVILLSACLWGWDCYQVMRRPRAARAPCADEDKALDQLAIEVDKRIEEQDRRQRRRAVPVITDPTLDPIQTMNINRPGRRRLGTDSGGWPT